MPKTTLINTSKNRRSDWGHQPIGEKREGRISIMFQDMGGTGNASDQPIQHKLYTFKNNMINKGTAIVGLAEENI